MKYRFKQAISVRPKDRVARNFFLGTHEVPEEYEQDPYFLKLVALGLVVEVDEVKVCSPTADADRAKALFDKLVTKKRLSDVPPAIEVVQESIGGVATPPIVPDPSPVVEEAEEPKADKKKRK